MLYMKLSTLLNCIEILCNCIFSYKSNAFPNEYFERMLMIPNSVCAKIRVFVINWPTNIYLLCDSKVSQINT